MLKSENVEKYVENVEKVCKKGGIILFILVSNKVNPKVKPITSIPTNNPQKEAQPSESSPQQDSTTKPKTTQDEKQKHHQHHTLYIAK